MGKPIQWSSHCRYLGIYFATGRAFKCSFDRSKSQFFKSLNAIFSSRTVRIWRDGPQLASCQCLPVLLYGVESCSLLVRDKRSLEFTVTRSFMKLFGLDRLLLLMSAKIFSFPPTYIPGRYPYGKISTKKLITNDNSICRLFVKRAGTNLKKIFSSYGKWQC